MIWVQIESIKRRKIEAGGVKWKHSVTTGPNNENDPQNVPRWKVQKIGKKKHNLSKNISNNSLN